ncbi:MAG: hypothetical protein EBR23_08930, partial [Planctomycetia bacterium]|nr:hypothetical protein [Planctomycetia bacterium]
MSAANTYTGDTRFDTTTSTSNLGYIALRNPLAAQYSAFDASSVNGGNANFFGTTVSTLGGITNGGSASPIGVILPTYGLNLNVGSGPIANGVAVTKYYSGVLSGAGDLTVGGPGTQVFAGNNTYTGTTTITGGALKLANDLAMQSSAYNTDSTGVLDVTGLSATGGTFGGLVGGTNWTIPANLTTLNLNPSSTLPPTGIVRTYSGSLGGTSALVMKTGATGIQVLSGANTYSGGTTVNAGILFARNPSALGTGNVTVAAGQTLNYQAASDAALSIGGTLSLAGANSVIGGTLGSTATSAQINVAGAATAAAAAMKVNVFAAPGISPTTGTYTLLQGGAGSNLTGTGWTTNLVYNNTNFTVGAPTATTSTVTVPVTGGLTPLSTTFWRGGLAGATTTVNQTWAVSNGATQSNFVTSLANVNQPLVPGSAATVIFSNLTNSQAATSSTLGADMTLGSLINTDTSAVQLTADGFRLTLSPSNANSGIFMTNATSSSTNNTVVGNMTLSAPLTLGASQTWRNDSTNTLTLGGNITNGSSNLLVRGTGNTAINGIFLGSGSGGLTKYGTGTLTITGNNGANTFTGPTALYQGATTLQGTFGTIRNTSGITFNSGTLTLSNGQTDAETGVVRIGSGVGITSYGGGFTVSNASQAVGTNTYNIAPGLAYTETVGAVTLQNGQFDISLGTD